jgi:hypothetical protein
MIEDANGTPDAPSIFSTYCRSYFQIWRKS